MYLELRHLRTLQAIRATGSLAEAAAQLHVTQSALSHQVKALEQHFDTALFFRNSRPLRFSPAGELLLDLAERLLPDVAGVEQRLSGMARGHQGRLHIAIECHSCFQWLLPTMNHYRENWPGVEMDLSLGFSFHPLPALVRGEIDLVVTSDPDPDLSGIHYEPLFRHEVRLAMNLGSRLTAKPWLEPHDLAAETLITYPVCRSRLDVFAHFLEPANVEPATVRTSELTVMIIQLVVSGRGVAALPSWALDEHCDQGQLVARPLGRDGLWSPLYAAVREENRPAPFIDAFLTLARAVTTERLNGIQPLEGRSADLR